MKEDVREILCLETHRKDYLEWQLLAQIKG